VKFGKLHIARIALLLGALSTQTAHASLVFSGVATGQGAGIGTSNVVLTIQNTPTEAGCVAWDGTQDVIGSLACPGGLSPAIAGGNEKTGSSQTQTRTVAEAGLTTGANLIVLLNVSEPGGTLFTVENLSLTVYSSAGAVLYNTGNVVGAGVPPGGITIDSSFQGQGNLGFAFELDAAQAAAINPFLATTTNRLGLASILTNTQGGNETFSVANRANVAITPEPFTLVTMMSGLVFLALSRRWFPGRGRT
jgi:hypothetical protein